jgi:hypothetical protein
LDEWQVNIKKAKLRNAKIINTSTILFKKVSILLHNFVPMLEKLWSYDAKFERKIITYVLFTFEGIFETESCYVAYVTSNIQFSCLNFQSAGISGAHHNAHLTTYFIAQYTFISEARGTFSKIGHILGTKQGSTNIRKLK